MNDRTLTQNTHDLTCVGCFRVHLGIDNLVAHFEELTLSEALPALKDLKEIGGLLYNRFATTEAYEKALKGIHPYRSEVSNTQA